MYWGRCRLYIPQGWSLFGYTCFESIDVVLAFEPIIDHIIIVKDYAGNAYLPEWNYNGMGNLNYSVGYQIKVVQEINNFQFCPTIIITE